MIELKGIQKTYIMRTNSVTALEEIDLKIEKGEIFGIIGHSGAGKSTLIRTINLLERPTQGSVWIDGIELTSLSSKHLQQERRKIGMIFQHFNLLSSATVWENVAFPLQLSNTSKREIDEKVDTLLELVGLTEHRDKYSSQLSGGQKQRVGIARALANDPKVLLCDEATSALDPQTTQSILELLREINKSLGLTVVLITHEMNVIRSICDRVAVIDSGRIVETGSVVNVFLHPQHRATQEFVSQVNDGSIEDVLTELDTSPTIGKKAIVSFVGESVYQPILFTIASELSISINILHGTISRLKETPYGRLLITIDGSDDDVEKAIEAMRSKSVEVEVLA